MQLYRPAVPAPAAAVVTCNGGMRISDPTPSTTRRLPRLLRGGPKPARTSSVELDGGEKKQMGRVVNTHRELRVLLMAGAPEI